MYCRTARFMRARVKLYQPRINTQCINLDFAQKKNLNNPHNRPSILMFFTTFIPCSVNKLNKNHQDKIHFLIFIDSVDHHENKNYFLSFQMKLNFSKSTVRKFVLSPSSPTKKTASCPKWRKGDRKWFC